MGKDKMKNRNVYDVLKYDSYSRLSVGDRWLVMEEKSNLSWDYVVYEENGRKVVEAYRGDSETDAIAILSPYN
jgi:hypothetical protein